MNERERLKVILTAAEDTKAEEIQVFDMDNRSPITDYVVLCNGRSQGHVRGIAEKIEQAMKKHGLRSQTVEGLQEGSWVLLDFDVVLIHVFHPETRAYYDLDTLLADYPRMDTATGKWIPVKKEKPEKALDAASASTKKATKTGARTAAAKKSPTKKAASKDAPAKKVPAKKAPAKKELAKKAPAKRPMLKTTVGKAAGRSEGKAAAKPAAKTTAKAAGSRAAKTTKPSGRAG